MKNLKKILIIRTEHIGDYALSLRALASLRKAFPKARIDIIVGPWNEAIANATPYVNRVIVFEHPFVKRHIGYLGILRAIFLDTPKVLGWIKKINKEKYDLLVNFSDRKYTRILDWMINARYKILGKDLPYSGGRDRARIEGLLEKFDIPIIRGKETLSYSNKDKELVKGLTQSGEYIVVHPITPLSEKNWPLENWIRLIEKIIAKKKKKIVLIGTVKEREIIQKQIVERLNKNVQKEVINVSGKLNIVQTIFLISKSKLIIGGDSGPVHLAEMTSTSILALFGPTNVERWGPPINQGDFIKKERIEDISIEEVYNKIGK